MARITLSRVAEAAGVSTSTASLALAGDQRIAKATRERIVAAASELGYVRDPLLSSLAAHRFRHTGKPALIAAWGVDDGNLAGIAPTMGMAVHNLGGLAADGLAAALTGLGASALVVNRRGVDPHALARLPVPVVLLAEDDPGTLAVDVVETSDWWSTITATLAEMRRHGYRRPALVLHTAQPRHWHDDVRLAAARFLGVPVHEVDRDRPEEVAGFLDRTSPDSVVGLVAETAWLLRQIGRPLPVACMITMDAPFCAGLAGMRLDHEHRDRTTLELIEHRLRHGPRPPRRIIIPPRWVEGPSLPVTAPT